MQAMLEKGHQWQENGNPLLDFNLRLGDRGEKMKDIHRQLDEAINANPVRSRRLR